MKAALLVTGLGAATGSMALVALLAVLGNFGPGMDAPTAASAHLSHARLADAGALQKRHGARIGARIAEGG